MALSWKEQLTQALIKKFGNKQGHLLKEKYVNAFPYNYCEQQSIQHALLDITEMEKLSADHPVNIRLYTIQRNNQNELHTKLYQFENAIPLSDVLPMLENMDIRTLSENPYAIQTHDKKTIWISDSIVIYKQPLPLNIDEVNDNFSEAFKHILKCHCENDGFNKLILSADLSWREVSILRAYFKYLHQTRFRFSQNYIETTLSVHADVVKLLVNLFLTLHNPKQKSIAKSAATKLEEAIAVKLDAIKSLDEDRILRRFLALIKATLRTNYFQTTKDEKPKSYLAFKFLSAAVPELPLPHPLYEIFVYAPLFEAIHLRNEKVSRGGLRWSDRREDFRTEILGLMKAQKVKNAVIVPSGAKGGFVLKGNPATFKKTDVIECYQTFIRGLLDLTDNLVKNKINPPAQVVCYDEADPYLVVAADKGTAAFSDIANAISKEYNFWLGDAFASGGTAGYDHKKMGITARGAWESIKRHFHELEIDVEKTDFTVAGIGDMSGDVFGNGMMYTRHIKLVAAFDHRDIFLDPSPHPEKSYDERVRLFNLPTSSWQDYDKKLLSPGGGIYSRSSKSIAITPQVKKLLGIQETSLTPNELIRAILKAPVDLLYNGGIGTYVKATQENHADVGDKANEFCRINGSEVQAKVIGEGGNLGFTQLGRIECALNGKLINTDFIDNSGGVDCSDHEVNIKILLNKEMTKGSLSEKKRNDLLFAMTEEVAKLVLFDNYNQALTMSFSAANANNYISLYQSFIKDLEITAQLNREVEFLPDNKKLLERKAAGQGLTRPELAVLLAYAKIHIKKELLKSDLPENPYFKKTLISAFPTRLSKLYPGALQEHSLKREIIATQLANNIVNTMGITFVYRMQIETGASVAQIVSAHTISSEIYKSSELQRLVESLNFKVPIALQYELLHHIRQLMNLSTRWFLRRNRLKVDIAKIIKHYSACIDQLTAMIPDLIVGTTKDYLNSLIERFIQHGLPKNVATYIASARALYTALNVIEVSTLHKFDFVKTIKVYFEMGSQFSLVWFRDQLGHDTREGHWNNLARLALRDELDNLQRNFTIAVLSDTKKQTTAEKMIFEWMQTNNHVYKRWDQLLQMLHSTTNTDYTLFFVTLRELEDLIKGTRATA